MAQHLDGQVLQPCVPLLFFYLLEKCHSEVILHTIAYTHKHIRRVFSMLFFLAFLTTFQNLDEDAVCSCQKERDAA